MTRSLLAVGLVLVMVWPATAAPPADVADLFPPGTLAYAEFHNPAELGPQLAAVFKGTPLEDSITFVHEKLDAAKTLPAHQAKRRLAELALFVSPEMLAEFRKLGGVAVGLTGFNERGEAEFALAVLTGDSAVAGLAARAFVTSSSLRRVADVSKVPLFQFRSPDISYDPNGNPQLANDKPPVEGQYETTCAYLPGLFVAGTSKAAVAPVVKRFLGEEKDSLRTATGFKSAAAEFRKPGLFFYANAPELFARVEAAGRARGELFTSDALAWLKLTANPKAITAVAGCLHFRDSGLALSVSGSFDPAVKSPLRDFFTGPPVKADALHHAGRPAVFAATMNLPEKERAAALIDLLDAAAKANGEIGRLPSDLVKDITDKHKVAVRGLLAKVRAITVIVPTKQELAKDATPIPTFVIHTEDSAAATELEAFVPLLLAGIAGEKEAAKPSTETIGDVKVYSLAGTGLPWKSATHYARKDAVLVLGQERTRVATAVTADAAASVAGGDRPLSLPAGDLALVGTLNLGETFAAVELLVAGEFAKRFRNVHALPPADVLKQIEKARATFVAAFAAMPPASVSVRRSGDALRVEVFQPKVQGGSLSPVITAGVNWLDTLLSARDPNRNGFDTSR